MKFTDCFSPEKDIIKEKFNTIPYMDVWICSIIEGYIYENVSLIDKQGIREEYTEKYRKIEGEYKSWYPNGHLYAQCYYKDGKLEGEFKLFYSNGKIYEKCYYKDGKLDGEYKGWNYIDEQSNNEQQLWRELFYKEGKREGKNKEWYDNGQLRLEEHYKEGKLDGEFKRWNEQGNLIYHKIYTEGEVVEDCLS